MRTQTILRVFLMLVAAMALAVAGACSTDSPTEPDRPPATPPGGGGGGATAFSVTVTAQPGQIPAGSDDPVVVTVRALRVDNGQPAPDGTLAVISALEGAFGEPGGPQSVTVELVNGVAQVAYFPAADAEESVTIRANVAGDAGQLVLQIEGTAGLFVSHVEPPTGSPQGGDTVAIVGSGFEAPVRVLFQGVNATVLSVNANRILVRTPPSPGPANVPTTVDVAVTVNVNEEEQASDSVIGAFTYAPGGGDVRQPTVFSITPTTGPNEGGTPVSIIGEGFQAPVQVRFCNGDCVEAQILSVSAGRIEVRSPSATGFGTVLRDATAAIEVTNLNTGLTTTFAEAFRYGLQLQVTGIQPDVVDAEDPELVTIFGAGFEAPLQVLVNGLLQQVVSVSGTEIVFRPGDFSIPGCPAPGAIISPSLSVTVRLLSSGASAVQANSPVGLKYTADVPRPLITGISPTSGPAGGGTVVNVNGSGFAAPVRVLFGGNQAPVQSTTANQVRVNTPAFTGTFGTEPCTATGGVPGDRQTAVAVDVTLINLDTGCENVASGAFVYQPSGTCVPREVPEDDPQCSDGIDNDADTFTDFPADPECSSAADDDEAA